MSANLRLAVPPPEPPTAPQPSPPDRAAADPLLIGAAAASCSASMVSWRRWTSAGRTPRPIRLGGRVLWRRDELRAWIEAGCPRRTDWEMIRARGPRKP